MIVSPFYYTEFFLKNGDYDMKYLITGGLGFVVRNLSRHFLDAGHQVTATGCSKNLPLLMGGPLRSGKQWFA